MKTNELAKEKATEWAIDYKPFDENLEPHEYAKYGYEKGFIEASGENWIYTADNTPPFGSRCWCIDIHGDIYLCEYTFTKSIFSSEKHRFFRNLIGHGWEVKDVKKWSYLTLPTP